MAVSTKYQMDKMFFTALYADRNNIPSDMRSKLMLSSLMPDQGMSGILSSIVTIDQHKEVLDKNRSLQEELDKVKQGGAQLATADKFLVKWTNSILKGLDDQQDETNERQKEREDTIQGLATFLANYIDEVHETSTLPSSFDTLHNDLKRKIRQILPELIE